MFSAVHDSRSPAGTQEPGAGMFDLVPGLSEEEPFSPKDERKTPSVISNEGSHHGCAESERASGNIRPVTSMTDPKSTSLVALLHLPMRK